MVQGVEEPLDVHFEHPPGILPSNGSVDRLSLPSAGSLGSVPLHRRYYGELRRPAAPPAALRCLRLAVPAALACSLPRAWSATAPRAWSADGAPDPISAGDDGTSQVPGEPPCARAALPDYASQPGSPPNHATLGSGWSLAFAGRACPAGFVRRFQLTLPPSPGFAW